MGNKYTETLISIVNSDISERYKDKTVLVEIPAYMDSQLLMTVKSAILQAEYPDRVHLAICYQDDDMALYETLKCFPHTKVTHVPVSEAKGSCYARYLCQKLLEDEDFVLHIDGHMRFAKHWDTHMIEQWYRVDDEKAVLSTYPPSMTSEMMTASVTDSIFDKPESAAVVTVKGFRDKFLHFVPRPMHEKDAEIKRNVWITGGFAFAGSDLDREILMDPNLYFVGDELPFAVRAYTYGYNVYVPKVCYVYHYYNRTDRKMPDGKEKRISDVCRTEQDRIYTLLNMSIDNKVDLGKFGLGDIRTLQDFEKQSGVYFSKHLITERAKAGLYFEMQNDEISVHDRLECSDINAVNNNKIHVIILGTDICNADDCMKSCINSAANAKRLDFTIVLPDTCRSDSASLQKTVYVDSDAAYAGYLAAVNFSLFKNSDYVLYVDSSARFANNINGRKWDEYLISEHCKLGKRAVLAQQVSSMSDDRCVVLYNRPLKISAASYDHFDYVRDKELKNGCISHNLLIDGIVFARAEVFKKVPIDPALNTADHVAGYALRLWTYGFDIYYPSFAYACRVNPSGNLLKFGSDIRKAKVLNFLINASYNEADRVPVDYKYSIGDVRRVSKWLEMNGVDSNFKMIEK